MPSRPRPRSPTRGSAPARAVRWPSWCASTTSARRLTGDPTQLAAHLPPESVLAALDQASAFVFAYNDAVLGRLQEVHHREREAAARTTVARRRRTLAGVLAGEPMDPGPAGDRLGYDLRRHHLGLVLWDAQRSQLEDEAARIARALDAGPPLTEPVGGHALAVWLGAWTPPDAAVVASVLARAAPPVRIAAGTPRPGIDGFRTTHSEACVQAHRDGLRDRRTRGGLRHAGAGGPAHRRPRARPGLRVRRARGPGRRPALRRGPGACG